MKHYKFFAAFGILFIFNLSLVFGDTLSVSGFRNGEPTDFKFIMPSRGAFDTLIKKTAQIIKFENKNNDTGKYGRDERKFFLNHLKSWRNKPYEHLGNIVNSLGVNEKAFYGDERSFYNLLPELINLSKKNDLCLLQAFLIGRCWPMHIAHGTGDFIPVWTEKEMDDYYGNNSSANVENQSDSLSNPAADTSTISSWF